jgi:hypothetical protein
VSERSEAEWAALSNPRWLDHLRAKGVDIYRALVGLSVEVSEMRFVIDGVPVAVTWTKSEATVRAGTADDGGPLYTWKAPLAWLVMPSQDAPEVPVAESAPEIEPTPEP